MNQNISKTKRARFVTFAISTVDNSCGRCRCREVAVVERFKQEVMYGQKEVAVVERWPLVEVRLYLESKIDKFPQAQYTVCLKWCMNIPTFKMQTMLNADYENYQYKPHEKNGPLLAFPPSFLLYQPMIF